MAFVTSKITACGYAFCAAEMAGELIRSLSENLPDEGACPCLWCRPSETCRKNCPLKGLAPVFGVEPPVFGVEPGKAYFKPWEN